MSETAATTGTPAARAPGRIGDPTMSLGTDPRADQRLVAAMRPFGMDAHTPRSAVDGGSPIADILAAAAVAEIDVQAMFEALYAGLPAVEGVERATETIGGPDGNEITLFVHRPASVTEDAPGILHLHGGGMTILSARDGQFTRWRDELAAAGAVVVGVEFRNAAGSLGPHPFPAGLADCSAALDWMHANRAVLGVSSIVVSGESGGGNLAIATALAARRDGRLGAIDGVYAQCPYISGRYAAPPAELPSLVENDQYFLELRDMAATATAYDPHHTNAENPLAWPSFATTDDLTGLPPHIISLNELDPLRDEGLAFHHALIDAGVSSVARTIAGTTHAADAIFRAAIPDVYAATVRDIVGFAASV